MTRKLFLFCLLSLLSLSASAQRRTDSLDRGLVAVRTSGQAWKGTFLSWRVQPEEYYGVTYNVYRDGVKLNNTPLFTSNYVDDGVKSTTDYSHKWTVRAVFNGVEGADSKAVTALKTPYLEIPMDHGDLKSLYIPNDACCADVDGDGELEVLLKLTNASDGDNGCMPEGYQGEYAIMEVYKLNGKRLWWIDLGPNMGDFQNNENNIVAYDWDGDGCAEAIMRAADGTVIHMADGNEYVIGDRSQNYRNATGYSGQWFINFGREYFVYMNGATGQPYQVIDYPLPRLEEDEWALLTNKCAYNDYPTLWKNTGNYYDKGSGVLHRAWGDNYGHRSTKHFFGAPYLDGRHPSIFLARGIYTRHKFVALDVDPATHELTERWRWNCNNPQSVWYGNGYHNYCIADVDWDGRDEIVFGSMTIDDNGHGLSSSAFRHGDAIHVGDLDPYHHGQEVFGCLEEGPQYGNNFRDGTTSHVYYKYDASSDDGRCIMANFSNAYPGCLGTSANDPSVISSVAHQPIATASKDNMAQNFRIYWDGDLLDETFNYIRFNTSPTRDDTGVNIIKYGKGAIESWTDVHSNNDTKGTPCYQGDLFGDWREEIILRAADSKSIRIYTTQTATAYRIPTLWSDHQYRNAMVWQMCGYNQPPHPSFFLGDMEGITIAPPPLTMTGRTEVADGATISGTSADHLLICETGDMTVTVADGASPAVLTVNTPSWVQGTDVNGTSGKYPNIIYDYFTHTLKGGAFTGGMRLVKQGDGILVLPAVTETYTGATDVWAGTLVFNGTMQQSRVWLNRFAQLNTSGTFNKTVQMCYAAILRPGGADQKGTVTFADSLLLGFGSRVVLDLFGADQSSDLIKVKTLKLEAKTTNIWKNYGPEYLAPVFELSPHLLDGANQLAAGRYLVAEYEKLDGNISQIVLEGLTAQKSQLVAENGKLYVVVEELRGPADITWMGTTTDGTWDFASAQNFRNAANASEVFVTGDHVLFNDKAAQTNVQISGEVTPGSITFNNSKLNFILSGEGAITGEQVVLNKQGTGTVTIKNVNTFTGSINVSGGRIVAQTVPSNENGLKAGSLGSIANEITLSNQGTIGVSETTSFGYPIRLEATGGSLDVATGKTFTVEKPILSESAAPLYKIGTGTLILQAGNTFGKVYLQQGSIEAATDGEPCFNDSVVLGNGGSLVFRHFQEATVPQEEYVEGMVIPIPQTANNTNIYVPRGNSGSIYLDGHCNFGGLLAGEGNMSIYTSDTLNVLCGDWSQFVGTVMLRKSPADTVGRLPLAAGFRLDHATLNVDVANTVVCEASEGVTLGALAGSGRVEGSLVRLGAANTDFQFSGMLAVPVEKVGTGRWNVSYLKPQDEIQSVVVSNGELMLTSNYTLGSNFFGQAPVTVESAGMLTGNGVLASIVLRNGAQLIPGSATSKVGSLASAGDFEANEGTVIRLSISTGKNEMRSRSFVAAKGDMVLNATVVVSLASNYQPKEGDEITLWTCDGEFSGTPKVELPELPQGLKWDTSKMTGAQGLLRVEADPAGIELVANTAPLRCRLYTLGGTLVADYQATAAEAADRAQSLGLRPAAYILRCTGRPARKIVVKD